jgi:hypothetical protein
MDKPIVQQIADQLKSTLIGVTKNAGYSIDLIVEERDLPINNLKDNLCVVVMEDVEESTDDSRDQQESTLWWWAKFTVFVCLIGTDNGTKQLDARQNEVWADLYKHIRLDPGRNTLAQDTIIAGLTRHTDGCSMPVFIKYRTQPDDITKQ